MGSQSTKCCCTEDREALERSEGEAKAPSNLVNADRDTPLYDLSLTESFAGLENAYMDTQYGAIHKSSESSAALQKNPPSFENVTQEVRTSSRENTLGDARKKKATSNGGKEQNIVAEQSEKLARASLFESQASTMVPEKMSSQTSTIAPEKMSSQTSSISNGVDYENCMDFPNANLSSDSVSTRASIELLKIHIEKKPGDVVGLDVDWSDITMLRITRIKQGLVAAWNTDNPDQATHPGDYIMDINGTNGDCKSLLDVVKTSRVLDMTIERRHYDSLLLDW